MNLLVRKIWILIFTAFLAKGTGNAESSSYLQDTNHPMDINRSIHSVKETLDIKNDSLLKNSKAKSQQLNPVNFKINNMIIYIEKENKIDSLTKN